MIKKNVHIIIVESSHIIYEGLGCILTKTNKHYNIHLVENISELQLINIRIKANLILINPALIQNQIKEFQALKKEIENTLWAGIVSTYLDQNILSQFDGILYITDPPDKILGIIQKLILQQQQPNNQIQHTETLSERETEVLKLVVTGNANKEIADRLNISINTVITHRKNITQKTGIKSVSGLTIYAVVNNIISIESYQE